MADLPGVEVLQTEIEKARDKLKGYNENIKKLTGRDPSGQGIRRFVSNDGSERNEEQDNFSFGRGGGARGRGRVFGLPRRTVMEDNGPPVKRRVLGGAFSRLGPAPAGNRWREEREDSSYREELPNKLSVQSSVVSTSRESKDRKEILAEQGKDKEGLQRNRRMFGLLLGTLSKFRTDSKATQKREERRKKIDQKLEENAAKEKKKFQQETKLLVEEMHLEQAKISRLQQKMDMVAEHGEREEEMKKLKNFIVTRTKPKLFWKPRTMNTATDNQLKESIKVVDRMLQEGRDRLENEIKELMDRETKREERIKMRLREDGLLDGDGEDKGNEEREIEQKEEGGNGENIDTKENEESEEEDEEGEVSKNEERHVVLDIGGKVDEENNEKHDNAEKKVSDDLKESSSGSDTEIEAEKEDSEPRRVVEIEDKEPGAETVDIVADIVESDSRLIEDSQKKEITDGSGDMKGEVEAKDDDDEVKREIETKDDDDDVKREIETKEDGEDSKEKEIDKEEKVEKSVDNSTEKVDRKKKHERDDSEENVKRRKKHDRNDSEEREIKKKDKEDKRRRKSDESRRSRRDSRERDRSRRDSRDRGKREPRDRRDSRDRDRSKRDKKESRNRKKSRHDRSSEEKDVKKAKSVKGKEDVDMESD